MGMLRRPGCGAGGELLGGEELNSGQVIHSFEAIVRRHQNMILEAHGKFERDCIGIGKASVHLDSGSDDRAIGGERNDFRFTGKDAAQDALFLRPAKALAEIASNLTPLHG